MAGVRYDDTEALSLPVVPTDGLIVSRSNVLKRVAAVDALGMIPVSAGTISSPVAHINCSLPAGHDRFLFVGSNLQCSGDYPFYIFSADGGGTFYNDTIAYDDYIMDGRNLTNGASADYNNTANAAELTRHAWLADSAAQFRLWINPGMTGQNASVESTLEYVKSGGGGERVLDHFNSRLVAATGRMNYIRIGFGANFDGGGSETFNSGSYHLLGMPTP